VIQLIILSQKVKKEGNCYNNKRSFTAFIGTIFEGTRLPLHMVFTIGQMLNSKGIIPTQ